MTHDDLEALNAKLGKLETEVIALHADTPKAYARNAEAPRAAPHGQES